MVMTAKFSLPLESLVKEAHKKFLIEAEVALHKLSLDLYSEIIRRTPVDTGRARANWNYSVESPDFTSTNSTVPSDVTVTAKDLKGIPVIFISNGLSYVRELEHGRSGQAPEGFIALSIETIRNRGLK